MEALSDGLGRFSSSGGTDQPEHTVGRIWVICNLQSVPGWHRGGTQRALELWEASSKINF